MTANKPDAPPVKVPAEVLDLLMGLQLDLDAAQGALDDIAALIAQPQLSPQPQRTRRKTKR